MLNVVFDVVAAVVAVDDVEELEGVPRTVLCRN